MPGQVLQAHLLAVRAARGGVRSRQTSHGSLRPRHEGSRGQGSDGGKSCSVAARTQPFAADGRFLTQMFTYYIARATASFGLAATRPIYERAIESLPDSQTAEMCLRFAALERKLGEIDRARAIYAHASQFCDPRVRDTFLVSYLPALRV